MRWPKSDAVIPRGAALIGRSGSRGIVEATMKLRATSLYLDGKGVVCGKDGIAVFDKLHSKANDEGVFLYAFDVLELNGDDMREAPLTDRKRRAETDASQEPGRHRVQRTFGQRRRGDIQTRLQTRIGRHCLEAPGHALSVGP
jgi:ATP-dependent DNA ligase